MPALVRAPKIEARSRVFDSARWAGYEPRDGDIVVATFPKCGTTWTQRILEMLLNASAEPGPMQIPWPDMRLFGPIEPVLDQLKGMTRRRQLKSHLPYDALPVYSGMKFIHVARDGRDSAMSFHNHLIGFTPFALEGLSRISHEDPKFGDEPPVTPSDPADYFGDWLEDGGAMGDAACSYWYLENSYWAARREPTMLLVHYNDLKADLEGEMRRIAAFLDIDIPEATWPSLVQGGLFDTMKSQGETLMPGMTAIWDRGSQRFLNKGTNGRWQGVVSQDDLALYDTKVKQHFSPALAAWLEGGRLKAGDPRQSPD